MFQTLITSPTVRAYIFAAARHGLTYGGGLLSAYLISKGASATDTSSITQGVLGIGMAAVSILFSMMDVAGVDKKITAAVALAPNSPQQTIDALKQGKF